MHEGGESGCYVGTDVLGKNGNAKWDEQEETGVDLNLSWEAFVIPFVRTLRLFLLLFFAFCILHACC